MQAGAALNADTHGATRVPVGLASYMHTSNAHPGHMQWHTAANPLRSSLDGSLEFSYTLGAAADGACRTHLDGMHFRLVGGQQAAGLRAAASAEEQLIYTTQHQVNGVHSAGGDRSKPLSTADLHWHLSSGDARRTSMFTVRGEGTTRAMPALSSSLSLVQHAIAAAARPTVALHVTNPAHPERASPGLAAAAATGLLRVAVQESAGQHFEQLTHDAFAASQPNPAIRVEGGGFIALAQNATYTPLLTPVAPKEVAQRAAAADTDRAFKGAVLITGGLGDLGQLTGQWVMQTCPSAHVWLLGRNGRPGQYAQWLEDQQTEPGTCVSTASCDATSASDMAGLLPQLQACGAPAVTSFIHSGGVLQDAMLGRATSQANGYWACP